MSRVIAGIGPLPWGFAAIMAGLLVTAETIAIYAAWFHGSPHYWPAMDYDFYRGLGQNWLATGEFYLPEQLSGPYSQTTMVHNPYPPHALLLFVPFVFLPAPLWWAIPACLLAYVIWWLRPAPWALTAIAVLCAWPRSIAGLLTGNSDLWVAAFVAAAIRWGWPALAITIKPTFAPLAVLGVLRPRLTVLASLLLLAGVALSLPLWTQYATSLGNVSIDPAYSLNSIPLVLIPIVAWVTSAREAPWRRWRSSGSETDQQNRLRPVRPGSEVRGSQE